MMSTSDGIDRSVSTEIVTTTAALDQLRDEWDRLALSVDHPLIYNSFDYQVTSWRHFDAHQSRPQVITVRTDSGELVGLAPFRLRDRRRGAINETVLEYLGLATTDRPAVLARPGWEAEVWAGVASAIAETPFDRWEVHESVLDTPAHAHLERLIARLTADDGVRVLREDGGDTTLVDTTGSWDEFLADHKKIRKALSKFHRRNPDVVLNRYADPETILDGLARYERLAASTWKAGKVGLLKSDATRDFYRRLLPVLAAEGRATIRVLETDDEVVAAQMGLVFGDRFFGHMHDHNTAYDDYSPGMIVVALGLQDCFESDIVVADFLTGYAGYLGRWSDLRARTESVTIVRPTRASRLLNAQDRARTAVSTIATSSPVRRVRDRVDRARGRAGHAAGGGPDDTADADVG